MSKQFKYLKRGECVCGGTRRDCRQSLSTGWFHCRDTQASPLGYIFVGEDEQGFAMWQPDRSDGGSKQNVWHPQPSPRKTQQSTRTVLSIEERDRQFKTICHYSGSLSFRHQQHLQNRLLTPEQID